MGSKTRKLRQQAGVAGQRYLAEQRKLEQARQRAERLKSQVAVSSKRSGASADSAFMETRTPPGRVYSGAVESVTIGGRLFPTEPPKPTAHMELAVAEQLYAASGIWPESGAIHHVADYVRSPGGGADICRFCGVERGAAPKTITVSADEVSAAAAMAQAAPAPTVAPGPVLAGEPSREQGMRRPVSRLPLLQQVILVSTILGMGGLPRDGEQ